ncbi:DUF2568 domain-containing protein [Streptomyces sp. NPDC000878]
MAVGWAWGSFAVPDAPSRSGESDIHTPGPVRLLLELTVFFGAVAALNFAGLRRGPPAPCDHGRPPGPRLRPNRLAAQPRNSPPLARRTDFGPRGKILYRRFTSACAGRTTIPAAPMSLSGSYPRVRGADSLKVSRRSSALEGGT